MNNDKQPIDLECLFCVLLTWKIFLQFIKHFPPLLLAVLLWFKIWCVRISQFLFLFLKITQRCTSIMCGWTCQHCTQCSLDAHPLERYWQKDSGVTYHYATFRYLVTDCELQRIVLLYYEGHCYWSSLVQGTIYSHIENFASYTQRSPTYRQRIMWPLVSPPFKQI